MTVFSLQSGSPSPFRALKAEPWRAPTAPKINAQALQFSPAGLVSRSALNEALALAATSWRVDPQEILGPRKRKPVAIARQHVMWLLRQKGFSFSEIAFAVNRRDHTTAIHGVRKHEKRRLAAQGRAG